MTEAVMFYELRMNGYADPLAREGTREYHAHRFVDARFVEDGQVDVKQLEEDRMLAELRAFAWKERTHLERVSWRWLPCDGTMHPLDPPMPATEDERTKRPRIG